MTYFLDTSALAKIYHPEVGSAFMRSLDVGASPIRISELARVEYVSATRRKFLAGSIGPELQVAYLDRFRFGLTSRFEVLRLTVGVLDEASNLLGPEGISGPLRTLDAIQYATLRVLCDRDTVFVCCDERLARIAVAEGHTTLGSYSIVMRGSIPNIYNQALHRTELI